MGLDDGAAWWFCAKKGLLRVCEMLFGALFRTVDVSMVINSGKLV